MTELSPQAQAVLNAANSTFDQAGTTRQGIAAALRAATDQVVPNDDIASSIEQIVEKRICAEFLAIAAELEGKQ